MTKKTVFDHVDAITTDQKIDYFDSLDESEKKSFNTYVVNMALSMNVNFLPIVNEVNKFWNLGPRETYLYYSQVLPKGKQYNKWIKSNAGDQYEPWVIDRIASHFEISIAEARQYVSIFYKSSDGKQALHEILQKYSIPEKQLKKLKLID